MDGHIVNISADTLPDRPDGAKLGGVVGADLMAGRLTVMDFGCGTLREWLTYHFSRARAYPIQRSWFSG